LIQEVPSNLKFPLTPEGQTLHLNIKRGDVSNRIFTVGDLHRAWKLSRFFDKPETCVRVVSTRTFRTFTGTFRGVPITLVATGMGTAMMDFVIREIRQVVDGPMAAMRLGTCGIMNLSCTAGDVVVASKGSVFIQTNYGAIIDGNRDDAYTLTKIVYPDAGLSKSMLNSMREIIGESNVKEGGNCSADSFYGSEGRQDPSFADLNEDLIDRLKEHFPDCCSLEMETYKLLSLAA
jgi:uridine phosphorylase